jgi:hypothetical protein
MHESVTLIYPDGTVADESLDIIPKVGERVGVYVVARIETKGPDDEGDTGDLDLFAEGGGVERNR